jgi:hypothetical protein
MKTLFRNALCACLIAATPAIANAEEESTPSMRLVEMMNFNETAIDSALTAFKPMLQQFAQMGLPDEAVIEIEAAARAFFAKTFNDPEITRGIAEVYDRNFTPAEIEEMIIFYDSPLGRKVLASQPEVTNQRMELGQKIAEKNQAGFQQEMMEIMGRYQNAEEPRD